MEQEKRTYFDEIKTKKKTKKIPKQSHVWKGPSSTYNVKILGSSDTKLHFKDTEPAIRNKLKELLTESKRFKFVTTLVLGFK